MSTMPFAEIARHKIKAVEDTIWADDELLVEAVRAVGSDVTIGAAVHRLALIVYAAKSGIPEYALGVEE